MRSEVSEAAGLYGLVQMCAVGRRTNEPVQNLLVANFLILNMLSLSQTKMDANCFFLLILHNQALLRVTFGTGVLSELGNVASQRQKPLHLQIV